MKRRLQQQERQTVVIARPSCRPPCVCCSVFWEVDSSWAENFVVWLSLIKRAFPFNNNRGADLGDPGSDDVILRAQPQPVTSLLQHVKP